MLLILLHLPDMEAISIAAAAAGAALGAGVTWLMKRVPKEAVSSPKNTELGIACFRRDLATGQENITVKLQRMLSPESDLLSWNDVLANVPEAHRDELTRALVECRGKAEPIYVTVHMEQGKRQLECMFLTAAEAGHEPSEVLVFFRDITPQVKQQARYARENEQLKREVRQSSNILNVLTTPIWLRGQDHAIRYCNLAYSEAAEEDPQHALGQESMELYPQARALAQSAFSQDKIQSQRKHIIVGGARKLYEFTEIPLKSENIMVGIAQDVTELENVQEELQRHISAQSELLESVTSAMAVFGSDQRLKFFNAAFVRLWGMDEPWLDTQPSYGEFLEILREKRRLPEQANFPMFKQRHLKLFTGLLESQEEIFYLPDGRTLRVLSIPHALGGILFAYEDVTDRLALERSYNTLIAVQRATLDNLHEGVIVFGEDGRIRLYNPRFLQIWKLEKAVLSQETHVADLVEKTRELHNYGEDWQDYKQKFIASLMAREVKLRRLERSDGSVVDSVVVPLPDGATLITFQDVTDSTLVERSLTERNMALQEADRLKTEFLANVSYELRSPLTSISGFSEMLNQNYFGELQPKQREYVGEIYNASQNLMHLINDILDIASIEAGYMRLDSGEFEIRQMLESVVSLVQERVREQELAFTFNCPDTIGRMLGDETRMKQVIFNLLSNAIKYTNKGGKVGLSVAAVTNKNRADQEDIIFTVEDTGVGISPEEQQAVFGKFYKGGTAVAPKSGTGLGLSMVKSFMELHGGRVALESTPGKGTKVTCYLPRYNTRLLQQAEKAKPAA